MRGQQALEGACTHLGRSAEREEWQCFTGVVLSVFIQSGTPPPHTFRAGLFPQEIICGNALTGMSKAYFMNAKQTRWRIKINHHNALCLGVFDVCNQVAIFKSPLVFLILPCPYIHSTNARAHCVRGSHMGLIWLLYSEVIQFLWWVLKSMVSKENFHL